MTWISTWFWGESTGEFVGRVPNPPDSSGQGEHLACDQIQETLGVLKRGNMSLSPWIKNVLTNNLNFSMDRKPGRDSEA